MPERIAYDEFSYFHENASEFGLPYPGPPDVRRISIPVAPDRKLSALVWGPGEPELALLHGGAQNAHTWDTVALALNRPLIAIDLPGHGHSDSLAPGAGSVSPEFAAVDVAAAVRAHAPNARGVVGMSLGGLTTIALAGHAPELVRSMVLVDVTPGVNAKKSTFITNFVNGPATFPSFEEILARTIEHNPGRTEASLRRGILHNAVQAEDGSWVWRYRRFANQPAIGNDKPTDLNRFGSLWDALGALTCPVLLARGMKVQSVVDDEDEAELMRRVPTAKVERFENAGHSIQGDMPVELAAAIDRFIP